MNVSYKTIQEKTLQPCKTATEEQENIFLWFCKTVKFVNKKSMWHCSYYGKQIQSILTCWTPSPPTSRSWWMPGMEPILSISSRNIIPVYTVYTQCHRPLTSPAAEFFDTSIKLCRIWQTNGDYCQTCSKFCIFYHHQLPVLSKTLSDFQSTPSIFSAATDWQIYLVLQQKEVSGMQWRRTGCQSWQWHWSK